MEEKGISVIVPLWNDEKNISFCIKALLSELSPSDELIVVDNNSTDNSAEIARSFKGVLFLSLPNGNVGAVRNFGARNSKNGIIGFVDSDCIVLPGWRNSAIGRILGDRSIGALGSKYKLPEDAGWIESAWFSKTQSREKITYINAGNLILHKDIFFMIGGFNEELDSGEDTELCLRLAKSGYIILEDKEIGVIHLGNPNNLKDFFSQQKWHASGMLGTFKLDYFDKPLIMTFAFLTTLILCLILSLKALVFDRNLNYEVLLFIVIPLWVPMATVFYRCITARDFSKIPSLTLLYLIYYLARAFVLVECILHFKRHKKVFENNNLE